MKPVTRILSELESGDSAAAAQLLLEVYEELRRLAGAKLAQESPGQTLEATALVHEAWLRLVDVDSAQHWNSRGHFFAAAAEAMRRILIERARHKQSVRGGGHHARRELGDVADAQHDTGVDLLALDDALQKLERLHPRQAQLVKLRYFAGMTIDEAAELLGIVSSTASADWVYAKSWLRLEMQ